MKAPRTQYGALALRRTATNQTEVLLVTSLESRRWVIPKGWPKVGEAHEAAAREAFEEAGVLGETETSALGVYSYLKRGRDGRDRLCQVEVHLMELVEEAADWPEKEQRQRIWLSPAEAAAKVDEEELKEIILRADKPAGCRRMDS